MLMASTWATVFMASRLMDAVAQDSRSGFTIIVMTSVEGGLKAKYSVLLSNKSTLCAPVVGYM